MTPITPDFNTTIGALEIGISISILLLGALAVQSFAYYRKFPSDNWRIKLLVSNGLALLETILLTTQVTIVCLLEFGHSICLCHAFYIMTIIHFGRVDMLVKPPDSLKISILFSSTLPALVQSFFAYRVYQLAANNYMAILCWALSFWRFVCGVWITAGALVSPNIVLFIAKYKWLITMAYACGALVDFLISASLCYFLKKRRYASTWRAARIIDNLVAWTIESGSITSLSSIACLICFLVMPNNFVWLAIYAFVDRLYSNSLLALLNARTSQSEQARCLSPRLESRDPESMGTLSVPFSSFVVGGMSKNSQDIESQFNMGSVK